MAALVVVALGRGRPRAARRAHAVTLVAAGALLGLAFEVKLFEALLAGAAARRCCGGSGAARHARRSAHGPLRRRAAACVAVGLAWLVAVTVLVPAGQRPWAFGSTNGSAWNAIFVYDGWDRLSGSAQVHAGTASGTGRACPAAPGPLRLLSGAGHLGARLGFMLVAAWLALAGVGGARRVGAAGPRGPRRSGRARRCG